MASSTAAPAKHGVAPAKARKKGPRARVKGKDIAIFTRQLATMVSAGIALVECLEILHDQAADPGFKWTLNSIIERIRAGSDFSNALTEHPRVFTEIYVNMIRAGEASGQLDIILDRLSEFMEASEELRREVKSAMTYPIISLAMILLITVGLVVGIVPKFQEIFNSLGMTELPTPTAVLMTISNIMRHHFLAIIVTCVAIVLAFRFAIKTNKGRHIWDRAKMHFPIFGPIYKKVVVSRFTRTFSTLIQSGVPIIGALEIVAGTSGNVVVAEAVLSSREAVARGEPLAGPLERTKVLPVMVTRMIDIGERTGALENLLSKVSDFYDGEVKAAIKALTSLIEPVLIGVMGAVVGGIVLAIFLPIIGIQSALAG